MTGTLAGIAGISLATALFAGVPAQFVGAAEAQAGTTTAAGNTADEGPFRHLRAFQDIASRNGGNRAAGTAGYDRSADYVADRLREAGYAVHFEAFEFPFFEERTPPVLQVGSVDAPPLPTNALRTLANSGSGAVTARLQAVGLGLIAEPPTASASGCDAADFADFERGAVALIRRGTCTFQVKVGHAVEAGAAGVVIMNEGTQGRTNAFSGQLPEAAAVPVVGVSYEVGRTLDRVASTGASVHLAVDAVHGRRETRNVIADDAADGDPPRIVIGAHLDSVPEGPGINDNGSGSAVVFETALRLPRGDRAGVQFAFWGAEERGLLGSRHHVDGLSDAERARIALYINLDMVGSPNFVRFVQGSPATANDLVAVARGQLLADFRERNLGVEERGGGRTGTDDASFARKGIPTEGLYTGAGDAKSEAEAGMFGGTAGRPHDACYHKACDTLDNINREVLDENAHALRRALNAVIVAARAAPSR